MTKLFDFRINYTNLTQGYTVAGAQATHNFFLCPNTVVDVSVLERGYSNLTPIRDLLFEMAKRRVTRFFIQRTFSMGDVLCIVPIIRYLRTQGYDPYVKTLRGHHSMLEKLGVEVADVEEENEDFGIILDWLVERDRIVEEFKSMHRLHIMAEAIGIKNVKLINWDWSCDLSKFPQKLFNDDLFDMNPYIVFHGRGTQEIRSLAPEAIEYLLRTLNNDGIRIVHIGEPVDLAKIDKNMTKPEFLNSSKEELFYIMGNPRAKALLTMDSGPLWISHFTKLPAVVLLGPTRPHERTALHPLRPEGIIPIELSKEVSCEPCIESMKACEGRIDCLRMDPNKLYRLIKPELIKFWEAR